MLEKKVHMPPKLTVQDFLFPGTERSLKSLYAGRTVVLKVFARFGCPSTRYDAQLLNHHQHQLKAIGASLVGIGFDEEGHREFSVGRFWDGEMYSDVNRQVYKSLHLRHFPKLKAVRCLLQKRTRESLSTLKRCVGGNLRGDGLQLGGTFVINFEGQIIYACPHTKLFEFTDTAQVIQACHEEYLRNIFRTIYRALSLRDGTAESNHHFTGDNYFIDKLSNYSEDTLSCLTQEPIPWEDDDTI